MSALAFVLAPVAVAVVLFVSGWAKVGDVTGTRLAFVAMRVPAVLTRPAVVRALPFAELALGCALLLTWGWVLAVVGAAVTVLFLVYAALVGRVLQAGDSVECHCFGNLGSDRVTPLTLVRNLVLVLLAALATGFGAAGSGVVPAAGDLDGSDWWWPAMTALVVVTAMLIVRPGPLADDLPDELEEVDYLRQAIPIGVLVSQEGRRTQLRDLAAQRPQLLVFISITCGACEIVAEWLPSFSERLEIVEVATVFTNPLEAVPARWHAGSTPWFDPDSAVTDLFSSGRPAAVLFGADGMLAGGPVTGARAIEEFVDDIVAELASEPPPEPAPFQHDHDHDDDHVHSHDDGHGHDDRHDDGHGHDHDVHADDVQTVAFEFEPQESETDPAGPRRP